MNRAKVALVRCGSYDEQEVLAAVEAGLRLLGGPRSFAAPGERILLKPNVLVGEPPERCVTTHPSVLKAVGKVLGRVTDRLLFGDSPGPGEPLPHLRSAGLAQAAEELGLELADFEDGRLVEETRSGQGQALLIARGALEADGLVNLAKLKTHMQTRMTGAVKNLYGCVPGRQKRHYHLVYPSVYDFAGLLVRLQLLLNPRLHIMDGILAMEGNGPRSGKPVQLGVLLFSTDPVALDAVMCRLVELDPLYVPTAGPGRRWGLGTYRDEEIELVGDSLAGSLNGDFEVQRGPLMDLSGGGMLAFVNSLLGQRPVIDPERCSRCGQCVESCPVQPKALIWRNGESSHAHPPLYKPLRCTRCFCCQEICPEGAITIGRAPLGRLLRR
jgi:uncharacterized protein (DUF362 family)/NAD-dependent dihydropyrimidine dehydrogenase PreA subunit